MDFHKKPDVLDDWLPDVYLQLEVFEIERLYLLQNRQPDRRDKTEDKNYEFKRL